MKKDNLFLAPVISFISRAHTRISAIPMKYIRGPTHQLSAKNTPAKSEIIGSFAPHGIKGIGNCSFMGCKSLKTNILNDAKFELWTLIGVHDREVRVYPN